MVTRVVAILEILEELRRRKENKYVEEITTGKSLGCFGGNSVVAAVAPLPTRKLQKKPSNYLFDEEDSPSNIVFVDPKDIDAESPGSSDDPPQIQVTLL
jgi:hypothetical protein